MPLPLRRLLQLVSIVRKIRIGHLIVGIFLSAASYAQVGGPGTVIVGGGGAGGGTGDVVGPASSTDNAIARFDSTTGKLVQNSGVTLSDGRTFEGSSIAISNASFNAGVDVSSDNRVAVYVGASNQITGWKKNGASDYRTGLRADGSMVWVSSGDPYNTENADITMFRAAAGVVGIGGASVSAGGALHLNPLASPPRTCDATAEGDIYSDTSHALCYCDGTSWNVLTGSGAGSCA